MRESPENQGIALHQRDEIVVVMLPSDGYHVAKDIRRGIPAGTKRVGDDPCPLAGRDEKEVVAEVLDRGVGFRCVSDRWEAARQVEVAAGGPSRRK
jgi:hypothetical protein